MPMKKLTHFPWVGAKEMFTDSMAILALFKYVYFPVAYYAHIYSMWCKREPR